VSAPLRILLIDDEAGGSGERGVGRSSALARELTKAGHEAEALEPDSVTEHDIKSRELILVDFRITEHWAPQQAPLVQQPQDGLAVLAVVRSWLESEAEPTGLALHSAKLGDLSKGMAPARAEHVVARLHGLEWAFSKVEPAGMPPSVERVISLATAVRDLAELPRGGEDWEEPLLNEILELPEAPWSPSARRQLEVAQLPRDELFKTSGGLVALRWLAHRVLPYPGVLVGPSYAAAILGVEPALLRDPGRDENELWSILDDYRYKGVLSELLGARWWRAGIEYQLAAWEPSDIPLASEASVAEISKLLDERLEPVLGMVACVDQDFEPSGELALKLDCVRLSPDDWPVFAAPAWMKTADVLAEDLGHYVDPADLDLLDR
jgi:hypothetical protein